MGTEAHSRQASEGASGSSSSSSNAELQAAQGGTETTHKLAKGPAAAAAATQSCRRLKEGAEKTHSRFCSVLNVCLTRSRNSKPALKASILASASLSNFAVIL